MTAVLGVQTIKPFNNSQKGKANNEVVKMKEALDKIWLLYYNKYLSENGMITEAQRRKVNQEIERIYPE